MFNGAPQTRAESLAQSIEALIGERGLGPGDLIGTMDDFRDLSGFGRATISEAARLLSDRGTVEVRPGRNGGLFVAAPHPVVRLRHTLLTVRAMPTTVADAIAVREALEPLVAADAARHRTRRDIADLRRLLTALGRATTDTDGFMRANWALHERIAEITPNPLAKAVYLAMTRCISDLSAHATSDAHARPAPGGDHGDSDEKDGDEKDGGEKDGGDYLRHRLEVHAELVEAIAAGDPERTAAAVERHRTPR
ncbi:FadR/GntR family transcriptional regulator [Nonomuraea candida]|uniref:FadR/GntR family transcriptional regulator n=1 Tax=Nonomuraea candida TaxID=359159 RepID=UPI000ABBEAB6|nr:FCD domain-containing protein [Nonomuraea candida]